MDFHLNLVSQLTFGHFLNNQPFVYCSHNLVSRRLVFLVYQAVSEPNL